MKIYKVRIERVVNERKTGTTKNGINIRLYDVDQIKKGYVIERNNKFLSIPEFKRYYLMSNVNGIKIIVRTKNKHYKYILKEIGKKEDVKQIEEKEEEPELKLVRKA